MDNEQIVQEAAEWLVMLREPDIEPEVHERFMEWLRRSPEHVEAYLEVTTLWGDVSSIPTRAETETAALVARARAESNIVSLATASPREQRTSSRSRSQFQRGFRLALAASVALLIAGIGATAWWLQPRAVEYQTGTGEQRTLRLSDGSSVELNSRSRIAVRFSDTERVIELASGQALFQVAKDPERPFLVSSDAVRVRAIGTRFDVNRRRDGTVVTVVEGRVAVADEGHRSQGLSPVVPSPSAAPHAATLRSEVMLSAGQQVTVQRAPGERAPLAAIAADSAAVTAWSRGELVFRSERLSSVIDEFNRYNARRIVLESSVEDFPITATFATTDSNALVKFLAAQPDLRVDAASEDIRISAAGATASKK